MTTHVFFEVHASQSNFVFFATSRLCLLRMTTPGKVQDGDAGTRLHMSGHFGCSASPLQNVEPIEDVVSCACDIDIAGMFSSSVTQMGFETFSVGLRDFWVTRGPTLVGCEISD